MSKFLYQELNSLLSKDQTSSTINSDTNDNPSSSIASSSSLLTEGDILIACEGEVLGNEHSLEFIRRTRWHDETGKHMILTYRRAN